MTKRTSTVQDMGRKNEWTERPEDIGWLSRAGAAVRKKLDPTESSAQEKGTGNIVSGEPRVVISIGWDRHFEILKAVTARGSHGQSGNF